MISTILMVCTGNICRSPMAEGIFQQSISSTQLKIEVGSAGTHALVGEPPDKSAQKVMASVGISIEGQRAVQCSSINVMQADIVLVMEDSHRQWLHRYIPESRGRVFMIGKWNGDEAVPDPYQRTIDHFEYVRTMLSRYCDNWISWLKTINS